MSSPAAGREAHHHGQRRGRRAGGTAAGAAGRKAGIVYSLAYGDQPALICELVDWARACGFTVVAAGKGTKYLPFITNRRRIRYGAITVSPKSNWQRDFNAKMFNSFLDGTKSAIEMAAVANATGLVPPKDGLRFPPAARMISRAS